MNRYMETTQFSGIIFDLDGVICHTDHYHYQAWKMLADKLNIPFDEKKNDRLRGVSRMESLEIILEEYPKELTLSEKESFCSEKNANYVALLEQMGPKDLSGEVATTLHMLRALGLRLAIGSSSRNAKLILGKLGLQDYFDAISDGTNISKTKPDPEVFLMAAQMLGLEPSACLVVEDADSGVQAAKRGGFSCAGIGGAASNPDSDYSLVNFSDLLKIMK